jgi:hypothetical protein
MVFFAPWMFLFDLFACIATWDVPISTWAYWIPKHLTIYFLNSLTSLSIATIWLLIEPTPILKSQDFSYNYKPIAINHY